jgi:hypothetical protein
MRTPSRPVRVAPLNALALEDRLAPALDIRIDYSLDASGFFSDTAHRAALERAVARHEARLDSTMAAITAGGNNQWAAVFNDPSTGAEVRVANPVVPANAVVIYAGGQNIGNGEAGFGGPGGFAAGGTRAFQASVQTRGVTGFASWGGSLSFDTGTNWYFGTDPAARPPSQVDFESVAVHELGHALGFGTSPQFTALVKNGVFTGPNVAALAGTVALSPDQSHFAQGVKFNGRAVSMQPILDPVGRVDFTELDYAALKDIGWQLLSPGTAPDPTPGPSSPVAVPAPVGPPVPTVDSVAQVGGSSAQLSAAGTPVVVSGATDGTVLIYRADAAGALTLAASPFAPFPGFGGAVRSATGDVTGDGVADIILGTGPGGGSRVRILDGKTYADVVPQFNAFENGFSGGVYLAAGDFDGDGRAEVLVAPDQGGGPRVRVLAVTGGQVATTADFFGIDDPNFRGGARIAVGDVNADGTPDLVVAAGFGGGPRVSILDGRSVRSGNPRHLTADFFAFEPGLRNGVYVSAGDLNGDGSADLVFGAGPGGGPRVMSVSGQALLRSGPAAALAAPLANAFVGDAGQRGGVRVAVKDAAGDGRAAVVAGSGSGGQLQVLDGQSLTRKTSLLPYPTDNLDGIYVG